MSIYRRPTEPIRSTRSTEELVNASCRISGPLGHPSERGTGREAPRDAATDIGAQRTGTRTELSARRVRQTHEYLTDGGQMPGVLYHYTSAVAGRSIITNRELWATHIRYMNDADEYVRAHDLAAGMVEAEIPRALTDVHRQKLTRIADAVRLRAEAGERAGGPETSPMFVTSFSRSVDCAHGWQAYASRRGSPGCALVFDADGLAAAARRAHTSLRPCIHDDEAARAAMVAALEPVIREMGLHARLGDPPNAYMDPDFLRSISWEIAWVAACAKGPEWDVEQEERLIARPAIPDGLHVPVKYRERPGDSVSIPFVRIGLSDDASEFPLVGVLVGYSERQAEMVEEFRALLSTNGLQRAADGVRPPRVRYLPD